MSRTSAELVRHLSKVYGTPNPRPRLTLREVEQGMTAVHLNASALLVDARMLATGGRYARAGALTVLALEELAKIPALFSSGVQVHLGEVVDWAAFWRDQSSHTFKQRAISNYGRVLRDPDADAFWNTGPYSHYLPEELGRVLDIYKQRSFYADFWRSEFRLPGSVEAAPNDSIDQLLLIAEERSDSFERLHGSVARSKAFLGWACASADRATTGDEPMRPLSVADLMDGSDPEDVQRELHSLFASRSSAAIPDYQSVYEVGGEVLDLAGASVTKSALDAEGDLLAARMVEVASLPASAARAYAMFKLTIGLALKLGLEPPEPARLREMERKNDDA